MVPYLEYVLSLDTRAYFSENPIARAAINLFVNRNIKTMDKLIKEILYPTVAIREGVLNRRTIKGHIPSQIWRGLQICLEKGIQCIPGNEIRLPNCTNTKSTIENISTKEIRISIMKQHTITQDLEHVRRKFNFSDGDIDSVPSNPFTYLRETFKDTAFRASQYKMLNKLIYAKKLLKICDLVETDTCERCNVNTEDFQHLLWECRYSKNIWKEVENQIRVRYNVTVKMTYHNVLMGFKEELYKNHAAINTIIMAVKKGYATKKD